MAKTSKSIGRPCTYPPGVLDAVKDALLSGGERPNRLKIARDYGVGPAFVYYQWQQMKKARTPQGAAPCPNPSETSLSGVEHTEDTPR